jgi:hypothetical protein
LVAAATASAALLGFMHKVSSSYLRQACFALNAHKNCNSCAEHCGNSSAPFRSPAACDRLVEAGALAQLFAILMGRSKIKNSKGEAGDRDVVREVEERCVSIISNLFQVRRWDSSLWVGCVGGCMQEAGVVAGCVEPVGRSVALTRFTAALV